MTKNKNDKGYDGDTEAAPDSKTKKRILTKKTDSYTYPRCEYHTRMDSSVFAMEDTDYFGTYYRSTTRGGENDRYSDKIKEKTYENKHLNAGNKLAVSKTGSFYNPLFYADYKDALMPTDQREPRQKRGTALSFLLYDEILNYKRESCRQLMEASRGAALKNIHLGYANDYPCIMVYIPSLDTKRNVESWYAIAMAYFIAHVNQAATCASLPIEVVKRSSFGHSIPAVDVTSQSFRINIGLIPKEYHPVLIQALKSLDATLDKLQKATFTNKEVKDQNDKIVSFNQNSGRDGKVGEWNRSVWETLNADGVPDSKKRFCVAHELTRKRKYVDMLADKVLLELKKPRPNLAAPLKTCMMRFTYSGKEVSMNVSDSDFHFRTPESKQKIIQPKTSADKDFWGIIDMVATALGAEALPHDSLEQVYGFLEDMNMHFIATKAARQLSADGIGSDSEYEVYTNNKKLHHTKITTATGMKAINLATFLSLYYMDKHLGSATYKVLVDYMYFETEGAIDSIKPPFPAVGETPSPQKQSKRAANANPLIFFDLNHCHASEKEDKIRLEDVLESHKSNMPIILDTTSATTEDIKKAVALATQKSPLVFLVSSGLKNEQAGADINPYGTVRIIASSYEVMQELYQTAESILIESKDILPKASHQIRKAYKNVGAAPIIRDILPDGRYIRTIRDDEDSKDTNELKKYWDLISNLTIVQNLTALGMNREQIMRLYPYHDHIMAFAEYDYDLGAIQALFDEDPSGQHFIFIHSFLQWAKGYYEDELYELHLYTQEELEDLYIEADEDLSDASYRLLKTYGCTLSELLLWTREKILFLGGEDVHTLLKNDREDFQNIKDSYETHPIMTQKIVDAMISGKLGEDDFSTNCQRYEEKAERHLNQRYDSDYYPSDDSDFIGQMGEEDRADTGYYCESDSENEHTSDPEYPSDVESDRFSGSDNDCCCDSDEPDSELDDPLIERFRVSTRIR